MIAIERVTFQIGTINCRNLFARNEKRIESVVEIEIKMTLIECRKNN